MPKALRNSLIIALIIIVLGGVVSFFADRAILGQTYARVPDNKVSLIATFDDYAADHDREAVEFELDGKTLRGYVYGPQNTRGLIIFRHGIFSQHSDYLPMIMAMVDKDWKVFAYDAIGCGISDGDDVVGMSQSPRDVAAAIDFARESGMADGGKIALWGHSWGGYGVAGALDLRPDVDACVTMSGFDSPMKILSASSRSLLGPLAITQEPTLWLNTYLTFGVDADRSASAAIIESGVPTLILHGVNDAVVPYDDVSIMANVASSERAVGNVSTKTFSEPGRSEHNSYFYSVESQLYLNECVEGLQQLLDENEDDVAAPEVSAYLEGIDRIKANTPDPVLIDEIDSFLATSLGV
ncbi:MAG: alpha/beta fold hydrolase [Eggerthellaceae bacterium]|nr:alpha/beta fold hydrolase [Eggerthellaceae bacterium]